MLFKRPGSPHWQIEFSLAGRKVRRSAQTGDRKLAEKLETAARKEILEAVASGEKQGLTWGEARERWLTEKSSKRSIATDRNLFRLMDPFFEGELLSSIDTEMVDKYRQVVAARASPATANRHINLLRAIFALLKRKRLIDFVVPQFDAFEVEKKAYRIATPEQFQRLLEELPAHARAVGYFAVLTGLRRSNVIGLRWEWIDMERAVAVVPAIKAKGKRLIPVPLSSEAMELLRAQQGKNPEYVFVDHKGRAPFLSLRTCWTKAVKRAGLEGFRFHDTRHTWATWHKLKGTPDRELQELGGWASNVLVQHYSHLNLEHLAKYAANSSLGVANNHGPKDPLHNRELPEHDKPAVGTGDMSALSGRHRTLGSEVASAPAGTEA